jgi:hypothetical protein
VGFDRAWFEELPGLSQAKVDLTKVKGIWRYVPNVGELLRDGHISDGFYLQTTDLVDALAKTRYSMDPLFRAGERHIYDFPKGRAYKKQWNVGFTAGATDRDDFARIGICFELSGEHTQGVDDYLSLKLQLQKRASDFDRVFGALGGYTEPDSFKRVPGNPSLAAAVTEDAVARLPDYRFFGKRLSYSSDADRAILHDTTLFAREAVRVFQVIERSGFY